MTKDELQAWPHLWDLDLPEIAGEVLLLIGVDAPEAFWVAEERRGNRGELYAVRTTLGWSLMGPRSTDGGDFASTGFGDSVSINFVSTEDHLKSQIERLWQLDIMPSSYGRQSLMSKEGRYALQMVEKSEIIVNGHYQVALPWRPGAPHLEDNYEQAKVRLSHLKGRLLKNPMLKEGYVDIVSSYISQGHAEQVSEKQASTSGWYLPHHPVQHPNKPNKVRVVFDCGVKYGGSSLNAQLLKGPDFMSSLVGVLTRFR